MDDAHKLTDEILVLLKSHRPHYEPQSYSTYSEMWLIISNFIEERKAAAREVGRREGLIAASNCITRFIANNQGHADSLITVGALHAKIEVNALINVSEEKKE